MPLSKLVTLTSYRYLPFLSQIKSSPPFVLSFLMNFSAGTEAEQYSCQPIHPNKKILLLSPITMEGRDSTNRRASSGSSSSISSSFDTCCIAQISNDHLISILQLLPAESIISFSMTCRKFRSLGSSVSLWESVCRREWGRDQVDAMTLSFPLLEKRTINWKRLYQQVSRMGSLTCRRLSSKDGIFPEPRASHSLNWVDGYLFLFGGGYEGGRHLGDTWAAYVGKGAKKYVNWKLLKSESPTGRFGHSCIVVGKFLVLFGGINDNGMRQNDTWIGQVIQDGSLQIKLSWKLLDVGSVAPCPRGAHAGCSVGDHRMVIHGGIGPNGVRLDDLWLLDISTDHNSARWHLMSSTGPSPPPRSGHSLTWIGGSHMVLFGGRSTGYDVLRDVWLLELSEGCPQWLEAVYDCSTTLEWSSLSRVGHSAISILGGRVLIYGGEDSERHRKDDFWLLDINNLQTAKTGISTVNSKTVSGKLWRRMKTEGQKLESRSFHTACADRSGCCFYMFGGMVDGVVNPAEAYELMFDGTLYVVELMLQ